MQTMQTPCGSWIGTRHAPNGTPPVIGDTGCLLLNFGHMPRSGVGDLSTHLADYIASTGISTWRFDFPGLGDSPGDTPSAERVLFRQIQAGHFVGPCLELIKELSTKTGISNWVLGGLCGGAVTAVLAARQCEELISGMLLIDLDVSLLPEVEVSAQGVSVVRVAKPDAVPENCHEPLEDVASTCYKDSATNRLTVKSHDSFVQRVFHRRNWVRFATGEGRLGGRMPGLRKIVSRVLAIGNYAELPSDRNQPLVNALCDLIERQLPVLSIRAKGKMRDLYAESVDQVYFRDGIPEHYRVLRLTGTNHVFTSGGGEATVVSAVGGWLETLAEAKGHFEESTQTTSAEVLA